MKQIGKSLFGCIFLQHFLLVYDTVAVTTLLIITDLCGIFVTVQALQTVHKTHRFLIPNDTYERVQTVPHLWRCKKRSAGAVNEQMPREIALTRHLQHFAYKAVRDA